MTTSTDLLSIEDLTVSFPAAGAWSPVVRGASLAVGRGEIVGLVGESGSGKTMTALAAMRLVPPPGRIAAGAVRLGGRDLLALSEREMRAVRGGRVAMVFQEPAAALDPVYTVGFQVAEAVRAHRPLSRRAALAEAERLLERVALPEPQRHLGDYPHQLSGGQRQRVMLAVALAAGPDLLLADEPTTALDVAVQAQILELLESLRDELGLSVLLITHDLAVVAEICDRAVVMYAGEVVEQASVPDLFAAPAHPYTRALLGSLPARGARSAHPPRPAGSPASDLYAAGSPASDLYTAGSPASDLYTAGSPASDLYAAGPAARPLVEARQVSKDYPVRRGLLRRLQGRVRAVDRVDIDLRRGECLALVGESGSGKTTLGRCLVRLVEPTAGTVRFDGEDLLALSGRELRRRRRRFQMVFQDPYGSLDPRFTVERAVAEPLVAQERLQLSPGSPRSMPWLRFLRFREARRSRRARLAIVEGLLSRVGLPAAAAARYPHELSGGQRQRVAIARALAPAPDLLVADEPLSALDVSVQAQILDLLAGLRRDGGLTLLLVAHDLAVVERVADRVAVFYLGRLVELAPAADLFAAPLHPYTASLLAAVPKVEAAVRQGHRPTRRASRALAGEPPSPLAPPSGCPFHPRCPSARPRCAAQEPPLAGVSGEGPAHGPTGGRLVACFYPGAPGPAVEQLAGRAVQ